MRDVTIRAVDPVRDVGELLTLQRAAYVTEAQIYRDVTLPALTQSYDEPAGELAATIALKAMVGQRIVGAGRARVDTGVLHIGRLTITPRHAGSRHRHRPAPGAGAAGPPDEVERYALFTGHLSAANLRLYERLGYVEVRREQLHPGVLLVHLEKPVS